jgi:hypothetical protein
MRGECQFLFRSSFIGNALNYRLNLVELHLAANRLCSGSNERGVAFIM